MREREMIQYCIHLTESLFLIIGLSICLINGQMMIALVLAILAIALLSRTRADFQEGS
jgi:hypothetical protein